MYTNRLRVYILHKNFKRNSTAAIDPFHNFFKQLGARYGGYGTHSYGVMNNPAHFFLVDDPTDDQLATIMAKQQACEQISPERFILRIKREFVGQPTTTEYNFDTILNDVAKIVLNPKTESRQRALCWSGVQVLAKMAKSS